MAWWSEDILGGDEALIALAKIQSRIEAVMGVSFSKSLYPLQEALDEELDIVQSALESRWKDVRSAVDGNVGIQVLALLVMAVGANFTELERKQAIRAAQSDRLSCSNKERRRTLNMLITAIANYENGQPFMWDPMGLRGQLRGG
jgi:hypothetical protein